MSPIDLELHDAVLRTLAIDFDGRSLTLVVDAYLAPDQKARKPVELIFSDVTDLSCLADFANLSANAKAGNINYWVPSLEGKSSYLYLTDGCLAINAGQVVVRELSQM